MKFGPDIHVPFRTKCNNFGDSLTFFIQHPYQAKFTFVQYFTL